MRFSVVLLVLIVSFGIATAFPAQDLDNMVKTMSDEPVLRCDPTLCDTQCTQHGFDYGMCKGPTCSCYDYGR